MGWYLSGFSDEAAASADEQIAAIQNAGFRHIDVRSIDGYNVSQLPLDHARLLRDKFDAAGIKAHILGTPIGKVDITDDFEPELARLDHTVAVGEILGTNRIRIFSYFNNTNIPMSQWQTDALRRLKALRSRAQDRQVTLYHENERHIFGDRLEQVLAIVNELRDGESFRTIFDFDNFTQSGDDAWENWLQLRDATDMFHLKESDAAGQHVPVGQGIGRVRDILSDAMARGWEGALGLEPHLSRSEAVLATGPHGQANFTLEGMTPAETFQLAAEEAKKLLRSINAPLDQ